MFWWRSSVLYNLLSQKAKQFQRLSFSWESLALHISSQKSWRTCPEIPPLWKDAGETDWGQGYLLGMTALCHSGLRGLFLFGGACGSKVSSHLTPDINCFYVAWLGERLQQEIKKKKEKRFRLHSICSGLSVTLGSRVHAQPYFQGVSSHTKYFLEKPQEHSASQEQDVFVCQCVDLETDRIRKYM